MSGEGPAAADGESGADWPLWHAGRVLPGAARVVSAADPGFLYGEGLFTTLALRDGFPQLLERHLARLTGSVASLFDAVRASAAERELRRGVHELGAALGRRDAALRLSWTPGPPGAGATVLVQSRALPAAAPAAGVRLGIEEHLRVPRGDALEGHKHFNRLAKRRALAAARARGAFDALLLTPDDLLLEATRASVVVVLGGSARTPALAGGCLPGIARGLLVEHGEVTEAELYRVDLAQAEEVVLLSSLRGPVPVGEIEGMGNTLGGGAGAAFDRLRAAWGRYSRPPLA